MLFSRHSKYKILFTLLFCGGFSFLLWHAYYVYVDNTKLADLPVIRASKGIIFKPQDPGGIVIPDKDKDIYNSMSGRASKPESLRIERDEPEQVITKAEALILIEKQLRAQGIKSQPGETLDPQTPPLQIYYLRVAKITSPDVFEQAVAELKKTYPLLDQLPAKLATKSIDGMDKYYVHLGPIAASSKAQDICRQLEALGKTCRVIESSK